MILVEEDSEDFEFTLKVYAASGEQVLAQDVDSNMNAAFDTKRQDMTWLTFQATTVYAWQCTIDDSKQFAVFQKTMAIALWEVQQQEPFKKGKADEGFVVGGYDSNPLNVEPDHDYKDEPDAGFDDNVPIAYAIPDDDEYSDYSNLEDSIEDLVDETEQLELAEHSSPARPRRGNASNSANTGLEIGTVSDRTFVFRESKQGTMVGVFGYNNDGDLQHKATIKSLSHGQKVINAKKHLLHDADTKMLLLDEKKPNSVFCMDLETEQVVEEWQANLHSVDMTVRELAPQSKYAQSKSEKTVVGINLNRLLLLDQRLNSANKMVDQQTFVYKKAPNLSCIATNEKGQAVTGDATGQIRFHSHLNKKAKTALPGLGDPITGVDVTADGTWALATTEKYLLVIPTSHQDGVRTAFDVGLRNKPAPIKLMLDPADVVRFNITKICFTRARFNTGEGKESWIVTSTGRFIITWNFRKVKKNKRFAYKIKKCQQEVVQDNFMFNDDSSILVLEKNNLYKENRTARV